jgi:glycosyltransferase involved in cell wall biosynthesis
MRILYSFPGRLGRTGIGMTAWQQVQGAAREGIAVDIYCGTCDRPVEGAVRIIETLKIAGLRIPYRLLGTTGAWMLHDALVARALRADPVYDAVHCWPLGALHTFRAARRLGVGCLLERPNTHTAYAFDAVEQELRSLDLTLPRGHSHRRSPRRLAREVEEYRLADLLLCPSEFVAQTFMDRGFLPEKLARTQYGYDPAEFYSAMERPREPGRFVAAFVGSCDPRKSLHTALRAWRDAQLGPGAEFLICGQFVPGYRQRLGDLLDQPSVRALGFTHDVPSVMRRADVLVLPSVEEGSALVTYEARACGCVLMVSDAAGARCEHMVDALVHRARDVEELKRQFQLLSREPALLERLRAASLAGVPGLTWASAAKRLAAIYRQGPMREGRPSESACVLAHEGGA